MFALSETVREKFGLKLCAAFSNESGLVNENEKSWFR